MRKANGWIFQEAPGSEASLVYQEIQVPAVLFAVFTYNQNAQNVTNVIILAYLFIGPKGLKGELGERGTSGFDGIQGKKGGSGISGISGFTGKRHHSLKCFFSCQSRIMFNLC